MNSTTPPFRIARRTDNFRYRVWCAVLFGGSAVSAALTFAFADNVWPSLTVAVILGGLAFATLVQIVRPTEHVLLVTGEYLQWGKVGGPLQRVERSNVDDLIFSEDAGWYCTVILKSASQAACPLSISSIILEQDGELVATEVFKRWPEVGVVLHGEPLSWRKSR